MNVLLPDALVLAAIVVAWLNDTFTGASGRRLTYLIAVVSSVVAGVWFAVQALDPQQYYFFSKMVVVDSFASMMKAVVSFGFAVSLVYSRKYLEDRDMFRGDVFLLGMFSLLGQLVMVSGNNFLTLYLGLELMSLSLYAVIALRRDAAQSSEAAMKYYVLGALASGFVLYGISMLYGATGSLELGEVYKAVGGNTDAAVLMFGVVFIVAGIAFARRRAVPHVGAGRLPGRTDRDDAVRRRRPEGCRVRVGPALPGDGPVAARTELADRDPTALSLIVGNITGIVQRNIKRMLAYSAISNMGFVLLGLLAGIVKGDATAPANAYSSAMFYAIVYLITTLGSFGVVMLLARRDFEAETIDDFKGLNKRSPVFAFVMMVMMFSLAGIPPTVGFTRSSPCSRQPSTRASRGWPCWP